MPSSKWNKVRNILVRRPGLWDYIGFDPVLLLNGEPPPEVVEKWECKIYEDQVNRTSSIANNLREVVKNKGYECTSKAIGVSQSILRKIIDGETKAAPYNQIDKIEPFIASPSLIDFAYHNDNSPKTKRPNNAIFDRLMERVVDLARENGQLQAENAKLKKELAHFVTRS